MAKKNFDWLSLASGAVFGGIVVFAIWRNSGDDPIPVDQDPFNQCISSVLKVSDEGKVKGTVEASTAWVDGKIESVSEKERRVFYRDLDAPSFRAGLSACMLSHRGKALRTTVPLNLRNASAPVPNAKVTIRNDPTAKVLMDNDGVYQVELDLAKVEGGDEPSSAGDANKGGQKPTVPLSIEIQNQAYKDVEVSLEELIAGATIDLKVNVQNLIVHVKDCRGRLIEKAGIVTLDTESMGVWGASCGIRSLGVGGPIRETLSRGSAAFRYNKGDLGSFGLTLTFDDGYQETYSELTESSGSAHSITFPKNCGATAIVSKVQCAQLEWRVKQLLANKSGSRWQAVFVTPSVSGIECQPAEACTGLAVRPEHDHCAAFQAQARL